MRSAFVLLSPVAFLGQAVCILTSLIGDIFLRNGKGEGNRKKISISLWLRWDPISAFSPLCSSPLPSGMTMALKQGNP